MYITFFNFYFFPNESCASKQEGSNNNYKCNTNTGLGFKKKDLRFLRINIS